MLSVEKSWYIILSKGPNRQGVNIFYALTLHNAYCTAKKLVFYHLIPTTFYLQMLYCGPL